MQQSDKSKLADAISIWEKSHADTIIGKFIGNAAIRHGGAINLGNIYIGSCNEINGTFISNSAVKQGGGINIGHKESSVNFIKGNFINNSANKTGEKENG